MDQRRPSWCYLATAVVAVLAAPGAAGDGRADSPREWPQFHGPRRDNKSDETGLLKQWPQEGPKLLWTAKGIGEGYSTVAIAGGLIYTTGNIGRHTVITALNPDGTTAWTVRNGPAYTREQAGTRSTPTVEGGRLYHENADGDVVCLDAATGESVWSLNILKKFHGRNISWALAESLLLDGNNVICTPGGKGAGIAALDKDTGRTVWVCKGTEDKPGYCSPVVFEHKGLRQIVTLMAQSVVGVSAATGKLLWRVEHISPFDENITSPIFHNGCVFVSTRSTGSRLLKVKVDGDRASVEEVWQTKAMDNQHGGVILLNGHLYGDCLTARSGSWACLELQTGRQTYAGGGIGRASLTYADGMLYLLSQRGTMALVRPAPEEFDLVSRFDIPRGGRGPVWAHPVVCAGRLYVRHGDFLYCYEVKG
ncbi:MAG: PQQ-binding-like beta-propeller repeat protein [Phycisphaerae bacterium]